MFKITIFLCVAILAAVSNAASLSSSLEQAQQSLNNLIGSTVEKVKTAVEDAKQKSAELTARIQAQANELSNKITAEIAAQVEKATDEVNKLTGGTGDVDVTECKKLGKDLLETARQARAQMKNCFVDKSEKAATYVINMLKAADDVLTSLRLHKSEALTCIADIDGFFSIGKALLCTNGVAAKAAWSTLKAMPSITVEAGKLTFLLTTLPPSLSTCTTMQALTAFYYDSSIIVENTTKCIKQKVDEARDRKSSFADPSAPEIPVVGDSVDESSAAPAVPDFEATVDSVDESSAAPAVPDFEAIVDSEATSRLIA